MTPWPLRTTPPSLRLGFCAIFSLIGACSSREATLQLHPASSAECETPIELTVTWDTRALGPSDVVLEVAPLGQPPIPWDQVPPTGSKTTARGIRDGHTFSLRDLHGRLLARRTFTTLPCPRSGPG